MDSETLTLQPGQTSYDVDPDNFQANCPAGYTVLGTGFNAGGIGTVGFVEAYGSFVGGFVNNDTSVPFQVHLEAICGAVPGGAQIASVRPSAEHAYQAMLKQAQARG